MKTNHHDATLTRCAVGVCLLKRLSLLTLLTAFSTAVPAQEFANIEYLCADWGPAMKLAAKTNEPPQFSDAEEEIYFLKQVNRFTRKKQLVRDLLSGSGTENVGHGVSIYLCKMKPDGGGKTEIKELWRNPNYPIETQGQSTWMDVNNKTHKIALAIAYAGDTITGLWTMNLDGTDLKRIITPEQSEHYLQAINHPSWSPAGQSIVFEEELRGMNPNRFNIARCDAKGGSFKRILEATTKEQYMQPSVSPDGKQIAFAKYPDGYPGQRWIWLADSDGSNVRAIGERQTLSTWGDWPAWSPDGKRILMIGMSSQIVDVQTGREIVSRSPQLEGRRGVCGWPHFGKTGIVGFNVGGILLTDTELREAKWLAGSHLVECLAKNPEACKW